MTDLPFSRFFGDPPQGSTKDEGKALGTAPGQVLLEHPATHILWREGDYELVYDNGDHDSATLTPLPDGTDLAFVKVDIATRSVGLDAAAATAHLHAKIDGEVGALRRQFVTDITGQQAAYARKFDEATSLLAGGAGPFPMLTAEAALKSMAVEDLAKQVAGLGNLWVQLDNAVEARRCGAKWAVEQAATYAEKVAAATVDWSALMAPILAAAKS